MKPKLTDSQFELGDGLDTRLLNAMVQGARCFAVVDFEFSTYPRMATTRLGAKDVASTAGSGTFRLVKKFYASEATDYFIAQRSTKFYRALSTGMTFTAVHSGLADVFPDTAQFDDTAYLVNGTDNLRSSNGGIWFQIGNRPPSAAPTLSAFGSGSTSGDYYAAYAYRYGKYGLSPVSPIGGPRTLANQRLRLSGLVNGPVGVTSKVVYISSHSAPGAVYLYGSTGNNTATVFSTAAFKEVDFNDAAPVGLSTVPLSRLVEWHAGRMYYRIQNDPSVIQPSQFVIVNNANIPNGPDVVDLSEAILDVRDDDGARVTAMASLGEILIVLTETACYAMYGTDPLSAKLERIYNEGCPDGGHRAVLVINGKCYWKSRKHVYRTNGYRDGTMPISLDIERTMDSLAVDDASIAEWCAVDYKRRHWLMLFCSAGSAGLVGGLNAASSAGMYVVPGLGGIAITGPGFWNSVVGPSKGRLCLVYDYQTAEMEGRHVWTVFSLGTTAADALHGGNDDQRVYFANPGSAIIRQFERTDGTPADNSAPISAKIRWAWRNQGLIANDKRMRRVYVQAQGIEGAVTGYHGIAVDLGGSVFVESLGWSTKGDIKRHLLPMQATAENMQVYAGHSSATSRLLMQHFAAQYKTYNPVR